MSRRGAVPLDTREWGRRDYLPALEEMRALRAARRRGAIPDTLLLVEHPPVITVGVQGSEGEAFPEGVPVVPVERGGKGTFHGPGQLVGYPIVDLEPRGRDVRRFVHEVEGVVIDSLEEVGVPSGRVPGQRGVWVEGARKIASVGIAVEGWVTFHGFAINVSTDLSRFRAFRPCGLPGDVMTSVSRELGRTVPLTALIGPVRGAWERAFSDPAVRTVPPVVPGRPAAEPPTR